MSFHRQHRTAHSPHGRCKLRIYLPRRTQLCAFCQLLSFFSSIGSLSFLPSFLFVSSVYLFVYLFFFFFFFFIVNSKSHQWLAIVSSATNVPEAANFVLFLAPGDLVTSAALRLAPVYLLPSQFLKSTPTCRPLLLHDTIVCPGLLLFFSDSGTALDAPLASVSGAHVAPCS